MQLGTYYYPEAWPSDQWDRDFANIRKLGLEFVHMGEFSWAFLEPSESHFDFTWLDRAVSLAHSEGLGIVLCTPTAAPPVWLTGKYPEVLMVDAHACRQVHGTRQHACWNVPTYRELAARVTHELGRHFGADSRIAGWQLDNELCHYGKDPCHCEACQASFRSWLHGKYGDINSLNRDWGTFFWSQHYERFEQIRIPSPPENVAQMNPHQKLDAQRWYSEMAADYLRNQCRILRGYSGTRQWITTNFIHHYPAIDPSLNSADFDLTAWTIYPVHGLLNKGPLGFRTGNAAGFGFACDFMRSLNGRHAIMELQPGQVNWGDVNPQPAPGAVRLWLTQALAGGASFVCTYRYRQPLSGAELYHHGLVGTDGVTPSSGGKQFSQVARELVRLRSHARPDAPPPPHYHARRAAIVYSRESLWDVENHRQTTRWDTYTHLLKYHQALKRVGAPVDVITQMSGWQNYAVVVIPACQLVDETWIAGWQSYVEDGGHLVLSCRTGHKDRRGHLWEGPWAAPLLDLIGADIEFFDTLPEPVEGKVRTAKSTHAWNTWAEILAPREGTDALAHYSSDFYSNRVAASTRRLGKGSVTYVGVDSDGGTLESELVRQVYATAGIGIEDLADGFFVEWKHGFWVATNFSDCPHVCPSVPGATYLIGQRETPPADVSIWIDRSNEAG
ncbi:MAG: beta-galactosidase [Opitutaceae bacterium]|nr:beta-galactosidase [Opitutaceae bacterium]